LTALGSGGGGASLTELRLKSGLYFQHPLPLEGVEMLPGSLPQLRTLSLYTNRMEFTDRVSVRSLLLAPGCLLATLVLYAPGAGGLTLEAIADEVSPARVRPARACLNAVVDL
jgi:hypothetical protein